MEDEQLVKSAPRELETMRPGQPHAHKVVREVGGTHLAARARLVQIERAQAQQQTGQLREHCLLQRAAMGGRSR